MLFSGILQLLYRIYSAIRRGFHLSRMTTNKSVLCNFAIIQVLPFQNNLKDLDPSYKTDLDLWDCFGRKKIHLISEEIWYILARFQFNVLGFYVLFSS